MEQLSQGMFDSCCSRSYSVEERLSEGHLPHQGTRIANGYLSVELSKRVLLCCDTGLAPCAHDVGHLPEGKLDPGRPTEHPLRTGRPDRHVLANHHVRPQLNYSGNTIGTSEYLLL